MTSWECAACGYKTISEKDWEKHMAGMAGDRAHEQLTKELVESKFDGIDLIENTTVKSKGLLNKIR
ncbi:hypothetical protein HY024_00915 [Candidatus Curtissbacteria bacterium]|nr:hypothetical protein [Candidatus Curtissbacteria bacterium]